jgi:hypothetical protein
MNARTRSSASDPDLTGANQLGVDARDAVGQHPDLLPGPEDLDDPAGFIDRSIGGDTSGIDEAIAEFERGAERGPDDGPDGPVDS